jgi:hypothetical protein
MTSGPRPDLPDREPVNAAGYLDGGAVLVDRVYRDLEWRPVRAAWWWHTLAMVTFAMALLPVYSVVALTIWQAPSRQPLVRRALWATLLTLAAMFVIGLPAFVVFSRRWYWPWRTHVPPERVGVGRRPPDPSRSHFEWVATQGAALANAVTARLDRNDRAESESLGPRWDSYVADAASSASRIMAARHLADRSAAPAILLAEREAAAARYAAQYGANKAAAIDRTRRSINTDQIHERLAVLDRSNGRTEDLAAARESLQAQLATAERMTAAVDRLEGQLQRICAQLGDAAARAEELAVCPPGSTTSSTDLTAAVDHLTAIRHGLEDVEDP